MGTPDVIGWWLCVGTLEAEVDDGDWNVLSGDMRSRQAITIDVSDLTKAKGLRVQLLCTVTDNNLDPPERTMVLEPILIPNEKFADVFKAFMKSMAQKQKTIGGHHHMP